MPFTVRVNSSAPRAFSVVVPTGSIEACELRGLIESGPSAKDIGFTAVSWGVFLANGNGEKVGEELGDEDVIQPVVPAGAPADAPLRVYVWVERVVPLAASGPGGEFPRAVGPTG